MTAGNCSSGDKTDQCEQLFLQLQLAKLALHFSGGDKVELPLQTICLT